MKRIAEIIKEARMKRNWTQERLAKELGITQPYFSKLESSTVPPSDNLCVKIVEKLGLNKKTFLLQVHKQRNSSAISKYLLSFPLEKIPKEVKEFLIIYETLDNINKNKMKDILSFITECANKDVYF